MGNFYWNRNAIQDRNDNVKSPAYYYEFHVQFIVDSVQAKIVFDGVSNPSQNMGMACELLAKLNTGSCSGFDKVVAFLRANPTALQAWSLGVKASGVDANNNPVTPSVILAEVRGRIKLSDVPPGTEGITEVTLDSAFRNSLGHGDASAYVKTWLTSKNPTLYPVFSDLL